MMMLFDRCQGNKGPEIQEKKCPSCGELIEIMSTDIFALCPKCGATVYSDKMECVRYCPKAKECVGDAMYARLLEARAKLDEKQKVWEEDDEW